MSAPTVIAPGGALLVDVRQIAIAELWGDCARPAHPSHAGRHVESFYVLQGELMLTVGDRELRATAGSWIEVPPGVPHRLSLRGPEPARCLAVRAPNCGVGTFLRP